MFSSVFETSAAKPTATGAPVSCSLKQRIAVQNLDPELLGAAMFLEVIGPVSLEAFGQSLRLTVGGFVASALKLLDVREGYKTNGSQI